MMGIPSSKEALELIRKKRFDLLITEIELPEPEGDMEAVAEAWMRGSMTLLGHKT